MHSLLTLHIRSKDLPQACLNSRPLLAKLFFLFQNTSSTAVYHPLGALLEALLLQKNEGLEAAFLLRYP